MAGEALDGGGHIALATGPLAIGTGHFMAGFMVDHPSVAVVAWLVQWESGKKCGSASASPTSQLISVFFVYTDNPLPLPLTGRPTFSQSIHPSFIVILCTTTTTNHTRKNLPHEPGEFFCVSSICPLIHFIASYPCFARPSPTWL